MDDCSTDFIIVYRDEYRQLCEMAEKLDLIRKLHAKNKYGISNDILDVILDIQREAEA